MTTASEIADKIASDPGITKARAKTIVAAKDMEESPILIAALVVGVLLSAVGGGLAFYEVVSGDHLLVW